MDRELLLQNIIRYCTKADVFPTQACVEAGVGKSFISDIKRGRTPGLEKFVALAAYLGVTTSDLVGDARERAALPALDAEIMAALANAGDAKKRAVLELLGK